MPKKYREEFLKRPIPVALLTGKDDEARDMFIRLQGGSSLTDQERRDAWPGNFSRLVTELGGKKLMGKDGHPFFQKLVSNSVPDRGKVRRLVAQTLCLFLSRKQGGVDSFQSISADGLDDCYHRYTDLDEESPEIIRFKDILNRLFSIFESSGRMRSNIAIMHLVLFADMLLDDFSPKWEGGIVDAFQKFQTEAGLIKNLAPGEVWQDQEKFGDFVLYDQKSQSGIAAIPAVRQRHEIYVRWMSRFLGDNLQAEYPDGGWTDDLREAVYYRDRKICHNCGNAVEWQNADVRPVPSHVPGGACPLLSGHALTHRECL